MRASRSDPEDMGARLWRQLLRMGWSAGGRTSGNGLRFMSLILAAAMVTVTVTVLLVIVAAYDGRDARNMSRGPRTTDGTDAVALLLMQGDMVGETQHELALVEPLRLSAPPPPGLPRWPEPGEAFLSPELLRAGVGEQIKNRYGRFAGLISPEGLGSAGERFAYVRPAHPDARPTRGWVKISGFGADAPAPLGEALNVAPLAQFLTVILVVVGGPAGVLVVVAARCGSAGRDRRNALLVALGASWWHRALLTVGEAMLPVSLGAAAGVLPLLAAMTTDIRLPITGYLVGSADIRSTAWMIPPMALASLVTVLVVVVGLHRVDRGGRATRPGVFARPVPRWRLAVCVGGLLLVAASPYWTGPPRFFLYMTGSLLLWGSVPSVAAVVIRRMGGRLAALGRWRGWSAALVAGRWIAARPGVVVRLSVAVVIGLGLITQVQVWTSWLGSMGMEAKATKAGIGDSVLTVESSEFTADRVRAFTAGLPGGYRVLAMYAREAQGAAGELPPQARPQLLQGPCEALRPLKLECSASSVPLLAAPADPRVRELGRWTDNGRPLHVRSDALVSGRRRPQRLVVFADSETWGQGRVKQAAYKVFDRPVVQRLGQEWLSGAENTAGYGGWVILFAMAGLVILLLAVMISSASEFLVFGTELAPLAVQTERRGLFVLLGLWNLSFPLVLVAIAGVGVAIWQGQFFIALTESGSFSWPTLSAAAVGAAVLAILTGLLGGLSAARTAMRWRPQAD